MENNILGYSVFVFVNSPSCARERDERHKGLKFTCNTPPLPEAKKKLLNKVMDETRKIDDKQLNQLVLHYPLYREIVKEMR